MITYERSKSFLISLYKKVLRYIYYNRGLKVSFDIFLLCIIIKTLNIRYNISEECSIYFRFLNKNPGFI